MNIEMVTAEIRMSLRGIAELYNRLLLVVGPTSSGKTAALRAFCAEEHCPIVNVGVELGRRFLELTERQRIIEAASLLEGMIAETGCQTVGLDNTEILFDRTLNQDPLRLLQGLSRNRTLVATWLGSSDGHYLTYASADHPEFRRYRVADVSIVQTFRDGQSFGTKGKT